MNELSEYYKNKVAFILFDPENNLDVESWNDSFKEALMSDGWMVGGITLQPNQTDIIEMNKTEEELFSKVRSKWRRNIRKAERQGVEIVEVEDLQGIEEFYKVISSVEKRGKFKAHSLEYYKKMWEELSKENIIKVYNAIYKDEVVATNLVLLNDTGAYEIYGGATKKGRDCEASYLLKWEIIKRLQVSGIRYYDQWGVAPKDEKDHPLTGISYFKSGFGGKYVEFLPQYVKVFSRIGYRIYKTFKK